MIFSFPLAPMGPLFKHSDLSRLHGHQLAPHELHDLRGDVRWGLDGEGGLGGDLVEVDQFPGGAVCGAAVQDDRVCTIKELQG